MSGNYMDAIHCMYCIRTLLFMFSSSASSSSLLSEQLLFSPPPRWAQSMSPPAVLSFSQLSLSLPATLTKLPSHFLRIILPYVVILSPHPFLSPCYRTPTLKLIRERAVSSYRSIEIYIARVGVCVCTRINYVCCKLHINMHDSVI